MKLISRAHTNTNVTGAAAIASIKSCCFRRYLSVCLKSSEEETQVDGCSTASSEGDNQDSGSPFYFDVLEKSKPPSVYPMDVERVSQVSLKTFHVSVCRAGTD